MADDDVRPDDAAPPADAPEPGAAPPPEVSPTPGIQPAPPDWYAKRRRRWPWVAIPVAVVVLAAGGIFVQHRASLTGAGSPTTSAPAAPATIVPPAPGEQYGFALNGAGVAVVYLQSETAVQRAELSSGATTVTPVPRPVEPSTFFAGPGWVASKTVGGPSGMLLRDGGVAQVLPVALQQAGWAGPAGSDGIWSVPAQADRTSLRTAVVVDLTGNQVGSTSIRVPGALGLPTKVVGGELLLHNAKGTYEAGPTGSRPISAGPFLASGTDAVLTWDCDNKKKCDARLNTTGNPPRYLPAARKSILGLYRNDVDTALPGRGVLSPDRRWVALELPKPTRSGARLVLVDLTSGHRVEIPGSIADQNGTDQAAWTPNSRYLLAVTGGRVRAFDSSSEKVVTIGGTLAGVRHLTIAGTATM